MRSQRLAAGVATALLLLFLAAVCQAQIPRTMNYQVMLTDDSDQPLANESVQMVFRLYEADAGGSSLWMETQNVTTNSVGVASVVLGSLIPITVDFDRPLWLQVAVDGEILSPRRPLAGAPYALGSGASGDGHSLDASDGSPEDVVYVANDGTVYVGIPQYYHGNPKVKAFADGENTAGWFGTSSSETFSAALVAQSTSVGSVVGNCNIGETISVPTVPTAITGISGSGANAGLFVASGDGIGVLTSASGTSPTISSWAYGTGLSGYFTGGTGVEMELHSSDASYPVLRLENNATSTYGDCLWMYSDSNQSYTTTFYSHCYGGKAGYFKKDTLDGQYTLYVQSPAFNGPGIYVSGYIYATTAVAHEVNTSRGKEAVFGMSSPEVEMVSSGQGRLSGGVARVEFDRTFAESITSPSDLRITATPVGGWSALYIESIDADGFELRSESGRTDVEFHWVAIGREEGHERALEIVIPDHDEEKSIRQLKEEEIRSRRQERGVPERPGVVSASNQ